MCIYVMMVCVFMHICEYIHTCIMHFHSVSEEVDEDPGGRELRVTFSGKSISLTPARIMMVAGSLLCCIVVLRILREGHRLHNCSNGGPTTSH